MEQFEKVREGLECCEKDVQLCYGETVCEYYHLNPRCWTTLAHDALALIRQQQERIKELEAGQTPRVMTLEEANEADAVWIEVLGNVRIIPARINVLDGVAIVFKFIATQEKASLESYGAEWRCWTQRPTDEQREEAKWE